jgi:hypothetical protein
MSAALVTRTWTTDDDTWMSRALAASEAPRPHTHEPPEGER